MVGVAGVSIVVMPQVADAAVGRIVTGADAGPGGPLVKAFTSRTQTNVASFFPYTPSFSGGVRVAAGDLNGDGAPDIITGSGVGGGHVKAFSGRDQSELRSFFPYDAGFLGGIFVASGDVDGDGFDDIITGAGAGARPHVKVFDGKTGSELLSFFAFDTNFRGGVSVAAGDVNGDGRADIIIGAGPGAGGHVKVFDGVTGAEIRSFFAYEPTFTGGVFVGGGDVNGDGFDDIIVGSGVNGHVKVFDGRSGSEAHSFFAFQGFNGGVSVAAGDMDGDGRAEILAGLGSGAPPHVKIFDGVSLKETAKFLAYAPTFTNGVFVAAASVKAPRLEIAADRSGKEIQLQWPSGCLCELEANTDATDPRGWRVLELRTVDEGNRVGLVLPTEQKPQFFRLKCDDQTVR
jgi:hypothetical protein